MLILLYYVAIRGNMHDWMVNSVVTEQERGGDLPPEFMHEFWTHWAGNMVFGLVIGAITLFCFVYVLRRLQTNIFNESRTWQDTLQAAADPVRYLSLILSGLVASLLIAVGSLLCVLPGLILAAIFSLLPACVVFGEERFSVPLDRLVQLISGRVGRTVGVLASIWLAMVVIGFLVNLPMIITQFGMMNDLGSAQEVQREVIEQIDMAFSPTTFISQTIGILLTVGFYLLVAAATTIMYFNFKLVPHAEDRPPPQAVTG
jgi:hypothetical protein